MPMLSVTLRQIEYATAAARHGGVTAAAAALNVSQPALSVALAQLEAALGQPLFHRRPGGRIVPTAFGQHWLEAAQTQLDGFTHLMSGAEAPALPVRLAVFEDLAPAYLAPLMRRLKDAAPDLRLEPSVLGFEALIEALKSGRADLALTWDLGLDASLTRGVLARVPPHAVLSAEHPLAHRRAVVTLAALAKEPLILTDQGLSLGHMRGLFAQAGLQPQIAHRAATNALMLSLAANGLGVGLSYSRPLQRRSHDGALFALKPVTDGGAEAIVLAQSAANPLTAPAARLATLLPELLFSEAEEPQPAEG